MNNPFEYGKVVTGEGFCNRADEQREIRAAIEASHRLFLYAERRIGKTSLVKKVLDQLPPAQYLKIYVDLYHTDGELTFVKAMANAIASATSTTVKQLAKNVQELFQRLRPSLTFDAEGNPRVELGMGNIPLTEAELEDVLEIPEKLAQKTGKKTAVVFDEFQQILEYSGDRVEHLIRSVTQMHQHVAYIFMGSRKHLIKKMFLDRSRPLYRSAKHFPIGPIEVRDWIPFIQQRFARSKKRIDRALISKIVEQTEGHPFYTQHLCYELWSLCREGSAVTAELIEQSLERLLTHESAAYFELWETCTLNQRRLLQGLAHQGETAQPHSAEFIRRYQLGAASNVQRSLAALQERDVIERIGRHYHISDRFFRLWILRLFAR